MTLADDRPGVAGGSWTARAGRVRAALVACGGDGAESAGATVAFSGSDVTGGLSQALAVVVLAGVLLTLVLAATGRRVVAILLGLTAPRAQCWAHSDSSPARLRCARAFGR